ncbi:ankyrin [Linnemannia elongata AG-77]|uniref:Ankyrin n=1 Tax=Linnemannia elongata AG-77 TaxID=1314771 RepID=A0A197KGS7_9FUNG|nr:ankyrin [Linnemannia elongata AG-77]
MSMETTSPSSQIVNEQPTGVRETTSTPTVTIIPSHSSTSSSTLNDEPLEDLSLLDLSSASPSFSEANQSTSSPTPTVVVVHSLVSSTATTELSVTGTTSSLSAAQASSSPTTTATTNSTTHTTLLANSVNSRPASQQPLSTTSSKTSSLSTTHSSKNIDKNTLPPMYSSTGTFFTTTTARIGQEKEEREPREQENDESDRRDEATSTIAIASSDCCSPSSSSPSFLSRSSFGSQPYLQYQQQVQLPPQQQQHRLKTQTVVNLLDLPTEILQEILCRLTEPRSFIRSCRQILQFSKSPSLRARYLWLRHGPDQVLTRKVVELHKLTTSILTAPVALLLVAMGASYRDPEEFIFRWACSKGHVDLVMKLLKSEPAIDLGFRSDWFLREAAKNGRQSVVATLLAQQDYTPSESGLNKAFEAAYEQSSCDTVKALLDYAEARGALLEQGSTQFHSVVPSTRRARRVLAGGLSIQKDADKALRYAVRGNDIEMVKLLMDYEADVHAFNEEAVLVAAQKGHVEILKLLIQAGADIETKAGAPLRQASESGHAEAVRVLCESGADTMWGGCSALRNAASQGFDQIIATLLDHGANVNIHEGTPLQLACKHGHEAAVRVLLRYGANHRLDDGAAYKLALEANNETINVLLIQAETAMRAKERELERILQQQGPMWLAQQTWFPAHHAHARTFSEPHLHHVSAASLASLATSLATSPLMTGNGGMFISQSGVSGTGAGVGGVNMAMGGGVGNGVTGPEFLSRGHKRYYSQMSNPLSVADLFRSGSVCGLVALDDEIRARQRSESNRL